jgi:hypothetical protein
MSSRTLSTALLAVAIAGCGGGGPTPGAPPPHGGALVPLAGAEGFAEAVQDGPRLIVYFLDPSLKSLSPAPSDVRLTLQGRGKQVVDLKPVSDPDPAKSAGLAGAVPDAGGLSGELSAKVDGKRVVASINVR